MNIIFVRKNSLSAVPKLKGRALESYLARVVVRFGARCFYNLENINIIEDVKPRFCTKEVYFSISHSKNIVAAAMDTSDIGFDIEFMKDRRIDEISEYLKWDIRSKEDFYRKWTAYEADVKYKNGNIFNLEFEDYMIALSSKMSLQDIKNNLKMYEVVPRKCFCEKLELREILDYWSMPITSIPL